MAPPKVEEKLASLPESCGVYLFKDAHEKVIYVGKAVNLRSRVRSYFQASGDERVFVEHMVPKVADIDWVTVANEKEALILENNLIKQFRPRFNINLKDDKTFLSIKIDRREPFPRLELVRRFTPEEGVRYFGPFSSAAAARETLRIVNTIFPIRKSPDAVFRNRTRPCIYYELGRCVAPCVGYVDAAGYGELLDEVEMFLRGRNQELAEVIRGKMAEAAGRQQYELAAKFRDQLGAVERTMEKQTITTPQSVDRDVFGYFKAGDDMQVQALLVRRGRLQDVPTYGFDTKGLSAAAAFAAFLEQFYARTRFIPSEVLVPVMPPDAEALREWLTDLRSGKDTAGQASRGTGEDTAGQASRGTGEDTAGQASRGTGEDTAGQASRGTEASRGTTGRVEILCPQRGDKARLVEMAVQNAESSYRAAHGAPEDRLRVLERLQAALGLRRLPHRIECYDISNISGDLAVGSQVTFENGAANKARYRRYKIKTIEGADDFAMMGEVLSRRLRRGLDEGDLPDLIIVDGGKGQLGVAQAVMEQLGAWDVDLVSLAKSRDKKLGTGPAAPRERTDERVFVPGQPDPIVLPHDSQELYLIERVRDEAHRFAIAYHRKLRSQPYKGSVLDRVPGIGPARKKALVAHFGSVRAIRQATVEQLSQAEGISPKQAEGIFAFFHGATEEPPGTEE